MKLAAYLLLPFIPALAWTAPVKVVTSDCPFVPNQPIPLFRAGYCLANAGASVLVYGPDGRFALALVPHPPGGERISIWDAAADPGSGFVVAVSSASGSGLVLFDRNGAQTKFIPTKGLMWVRLAIGEDHSIWVAARPDRQAGDQMLLHKYSASGEQTGSWLPAPPLVPGKAVPATSIAIGGGIVAVATAPGPDSKTSGKRELIRMDETGNILSRTGLDNLQEPVMALTADGVLYRCDLNNAVFRFDPAAQAWQPTTNPAKRAMLFGSDRSNLVFLVSDGSERAVLQWYPQPAAN